jgi:hypothetical protein
VSTPSKPDPARGWQFVEKLLVEEELAELEKMSVDEVESELRARGLDPSRVSSAEELVAGAQARAARKNGATTKADAGPSAAKVVPMPVRSKKARWLTMLAAAALGVLIWMVVAQPHAKRIDVDSALPRSSRARAELLRDDAAKECAEARWSACEERLDAAQRLDEAGESEARVVGMRRAIEQATGGDAGGK